MPPSSLRVSLLLLEEQSELVPLLFYQRLFTIAPSLQPLLARDLNAGPDRFFMVLHLLVDSLDEPEKLQRILLSFHDRVRGDRGVPFHVDHIADALHWTFTEMLGRRFSPEAGEAWRAAHRQVVAVVASMEESRSCAGAAD